MSEAAGEYRIIVRAEGASFVVTIDPEHEDFEPRAFADYREARGWAGGLRMVRGRKLIDHCDDQGNAR